MNYKFIIKYNYNNYVDGKLSDVSEYKFIYRDDMEYEDAINKKEELRKELIFDLSMSSIEDFCLNEFYILKS